MRCSARLARQLGQRTSPPFRFEPLWSSVHDRRSISFLICGRSDRGLQCLHEHDLVDVLTTFVHLPPATGYQVFNVSPPDFLDARIGRLFSKPVVRVPPMLLRMLFGLAWRGTRGAVMTPAGAWKFLSYPVRVDGSRLE